MQEHTPTRTTQEHSTQIYNHTGIQTYILECLKKYPTAYMHRYKTQAQAHKPDLTLPVDYKPTITCKYKALKTAAFIYFTTITITFVILQ
jgi:hypothetical protein